MVDAVEARIEAFVASYAPAIAAQLRDARRRLRAHLSTVIEAEVQKQRPRRPAAKG